MTALGSFGGVATPSARQVALPDALAAFRSGRVNGDRFLAYGNGRSYGDSCLLRDGRLITMGSHRRILDFDPETGLIRAEAGVMLSQIIERVAPHGWFLPVTPGTKFVTLGGAVANDVHGKNHHVRGTFGGHVEHIVLMSSDGTIHELPDGEASGLFAATVGGMGLTGLILEVTLRLMRVPGINIEEQAIPFSSLDGFFELCDEVDANFEYAVAWIDQLASGAKAGRGVMLAGRHCDDGDFAVRSHKPLVSVPFAMPFNMLNRPAIGAFNRLYGFAKSRKTGLNRVNYDSYFYPLDAVGHWNRLYGPRGFFQHQSVIPEDAARETVPRLLARARDEGFASFLTVLKRFGTTTSPGLLSFPRRGYTLTLDFPNKGWKTNALLSVLDGITVGAGGAVNPYKDARMSPETFKRSFPGWERLEALRDPAFLSDFWRRTALEARISGGV